MILAAADLSWPDKVGLAVTLIMAVGSAVASCLAAWRSTQTHTNTQTPSNGVKTGAVTENTNVVVRQLIHLMADSLGKQATVPSPADTQAGAPGSTLLSPPRAAVDIPPAPPPAPGP